MSAELFIPKNPIETYKEFQNDIGVAHPEFAIELARQAQDITGDVKTVYGSSKLIIHALAGFVVSNSAALNENTIDYEIADATMIGHFGGIPYIQRLMPTKIQTFMVDMYDVSIVGSVESEVIQQVMIPVLNVKSVLVAA